MSFEKRLERLEHLEYQRLYALAAKVCEGVHGISAEALLDYARKVYAMPEAEQRALFADFYDHLTEAELVELQAINRRHTAILGRRS